MPYSFNAQHLPPVSGEMMLMLACIVLVARLQFPELSSTMVVTVTGLCSTLAGSVVCMMLPVASNEITKRVSIVPDPLLVVCGQCIVWLSPKYLVWREYNKGTSYRVQLLTSVHMNPVQ